MSEAEVEEPSKDELDEQKIARALSIGLPVVTFAAAGVVAVVMGPATSILVVAAGGLLGVIAMLWGSLRILSGDAALPPDLEELDMRAEGDDALTTRKKMLLRALKDLENERAVGKLDADDYEPLAAQYRNELRTVMTKIDEQLAPNRELAEAAVRDYLAKAKRVDEPKATEPEKVVVVEKLVVEKVVVEKVAETRVECPKCHAKNEPDAKFCKECATRLNESLNETKNADENADA